MKLCLDAGHTFGSNPSPANLDYREGTRMFKLQQYLKAALERYGFEVVCTRNAITDDPTALQRGSRARGCTLLLSLHSAAACAHRNDTVDYVRVTYCAGHGAAVLAQELSELIASVMGSLQQPQCLAAKPSAPDDMLFHAAQNGAACLVLEHGFHTRRATADWLLSDENLRTLAQAEASLLADYYGMEVPEVRYELLKDIKSELYRPTIEKLLRQGILHGRGGTDSDTILDLGEDAVRLLVLLDHAGVFDNR